MAQGKFQGLTTGLQAGLGIGGQFRQQQLAEEEAQFKRSEDKALLSTKIMGNKNLPIQARVTAFNDFADFYDNFIGDPANKIKKLDPEGFEDKEDILRNLGSTLEAINESPVSDEEKAKFVDMAVKNLGVGEGLGFQEEVTQAAQEQIAPTPKPEIPSGQAFKRLSTISTTIARLKAGDTTMTPEFAQQFPGISALLGRSKDPEATAQAIAALEQEQTFLQQFVPAGQQPQGQEQGQPLTTKQAQEFLNRAGGDRDLARQLAQREGFSF